MNNYLHNKKVLFVTHHYLDGVGGGVFASRAYINAFVELFNGNVTLLYPASIVHGIDGIDPRAKSIPVYDNASRWKKGLRLVTGRVHRFFGILKEIIEKNKFNIVVFDNSRVSYGMIDVAHKCGAKVITIHHNCELEYNRDNTSGLLKTSLLYWTKKYEGEAVRKSDLSLVLTPEDKALLTEHYSLPPQLSHRINVIGVFESFQSSLPEISEPLNNRFAIDTFIITGNLGAVQSNNSILPWIDMYYPHLKTAFPKAKLIIAGKNPSEELKQRCDELGINLIPSPPSMSPLLQYGDCYICPISLGGGLKLRIMDGLKYGLPVITHSVSARGYHDFIDNGAVIPYGTVEEFVSACKKIGERTYDRTSTQELYHNIFSFKSGVKRLSSILQDIMDV